MIISLDTPKEAQEKIVSLVKERRLFLNLTQVQMAARSNVSLAVLRKFERTGKISLESFVKVIFVLGVVDELVKSLKLSDGQFASIDEILHKNQTPKRRRASNREK